MQLKPELDAPRAPVLSPGGLGPKIEIASFKYNTGGLSRYAQEFAITVALREFCSIQQAFPASLYQHWQFVSARQAIVSLYNFQQAIFGCKRGLRVVREWSLLADHSKIDQAQRYLSDQFENIRELRQTVLHSSEIFGSKDRLSENSVSDRADELFKIEGVGFGLIGGNFFGAKYSACFGGKTYCLELTEEKVRILNDITADVFSALEGVFRTMQPASSG